MIAPPLDFLVEAHTLEVATEILHLISYVSKSSTNKAYNDLLSKAPSIGFPIEVPPVELPAQEAPPLRVPV